MPLFGRVLICDWSAANTPKTGKDSIWIAEAALAGGKARVRKPKNISTRSEAMAFIRRRALAAVETDQRLFIGLDFAFGYPAGTAKALSGKARWHDLWHTLAGLIEDDDTNRSNRFEVAARLNRTCFNANGPFWGHPPKQTYDNLTATKPAAMPPGIAAKRLCEEHTPGAKPVWQLAYTGAVGSQSLLGIAQLERLRRDPVLAPHIAVWPFETRFADTLDRPLTLAEIYPSAFPVTPHAGEVKDAAQVRTLAAHFARLDAEDAFAPLLARPAGLSDKEARTVLAEEGWIVGTTIKEG